MNPLDFLIPVAHAQAAGAAAAPSMMSTLLFPIILIAIMYFLMIRPQMKRQKEHRAMLDHTAPQLPEDRPRYLMGVGRPEDLVEAVARGVDMFDCVMPTRNARNGHYFTSTGTIRVRNAQYERDLRPIEEGCDCHSCANGFSRSYLRHLDRCNEMLAPMLGTLHNLRYYQRLMAGMRTAIETGTFAAFRESFYAARRA